jgi:hypothetical protein
MPLPQAPKRQDTKNLPTPLVADILFSEIEDLTRRTFPAYGTAHPDATKWPNHKLSYIRPVENARDGIYEFFYVANRADQDVYNWELDKADIGGVTFDAVTRTYVTLRTTFDPVAPAMGTEMPNIPINKFIAADYVLARRRQQRIGDKELDSLYVVDQHTYVKRCTIKTIGVDSINGLPLQSIERLYYSTEPVTGATSGTPPVTLTASALFDAPTNTYWGLQSNGYVRTGRQLSCNWYQITSEQRVTGTTITSGDNQPYIGVQSYVTTINYTLPAVLDKIDFMNWTRRDGGVDIRPAVRFNPEQYSGPCKVTVTKQWKNTPFTLGTVVQLLPTRINYSAPFFELNVPECLHGVVEAVCDIGTSDPEYSQNTGSKRYFSATNYTAWPSSFVIEDSQEPYAGGYLRTISQLQTPSVPAGINWTTGNPITPPP